MPPKTPDREEAYFYNADSAMPPAPWHFRPQSSWWIGLNRDAFHTQLERETLRMQLSAARDRPGRETTS
jgi:hypothetical protein